MPVCGTAATFACVPPGGWRTAPVLACLRSAFGYGLERHMGAGRQQYSSSAIHRTERLFERGFSLPACDGVMRNQADEHNIVFAVTASISLPFLYYTCMACLR